MNYPQLMELIHGACFQWFVHVATPVSENISIQPIILHFKNLVAKEVTKNVCTKLRISVLIILKLYKIVVQSSIPKISYYNEISVFLFFKFTRFVPHITPAEGKTIVDRLESTNLLILNTG